MITGQPRLDPLMRVEPNNFVKRVKSVSDFLALEEDSRIIDVSARRTECKPVYRKR